MGDYWVSMRSKWVAVVGVAVLLLCYYNLLRSIPEHHDAMLRENFRLSLQVQERAQQRVDHSNASDIPFPPTNTLPGQSNQPELDAQIEEKKNALAQLKDSLFHGQLQLEALQKRKRRNFHSCANRHAEGNATSRFNFMLQPRRLFA